MSAEAEETRNTSTFVRARRHALQKSVDVCVMSADPGGITVDFCQSVVFVVTQVRVRPKTVQRVHQIARIRLGSTTTCLSLLT